MILLGAIINSAAIAIGALIGLILHSRISSKMCDFLMQGLGVCVLYIGIKGALDGDNITIEVIAVIVGGIIGYFMDIDARLNRAGEFLQNKLLVKANRNTRGINNSSNDKNIAEGFVSSTLFVCVGAMAIVGSMQSGVSGNHDILIAKSLIDMVAVVVMAATMGTGVLFSALAVLVYEVILTLSANVASVFFSDMAISEMTCVGSLLIVAIGLNMLKVTNIKVANYLPAAFIPIILCFI